MIHSPIIHTTTYDPLRAVQDAQREYDRLLLLRQSKAAAQALERLYAARHAQLAAEVEA